MPQTAAATNVPLWPLKPTPVAHCSDCSGCPSSVCNRKGVANKSHAPLCPCQADRGLVWLLESLLIISLSVPTPLVHKLQGALCWCTRVPCSAHGTSFVAGTHNPGGAQIKHDARARAQDTTPARCLCWHCCRGQPDSSACKTSGCTLLSCVHSSTS